MPRSGAARTGFEEPATLAAELLALCQSGAAERELGPRERAALSVWLAHARGAAVPAWSYVRDLVEHIVTAGRATPADLQSLCRALEPVLPLELRPRRPAPLRVVHSSWSEEADAAGGERLRNAVLASAHFTVVDCLAERHERAIARYARAGDPVLLLRDRSEGAPPHAIDVCAANGKPLGRVPDRPARQFAPLLDQGARYRAHLSRVERGACSPVLIVQAHLYGADATLGALPSGARRFDQRGSAAALWLLRLAVGTSLATAVALVLHH